MQAFSPTEEEFKLEEAFSTFLFNFKSALDKFIVSVKTTCASGVGFSEAIDRAFSVTKPSWLPMTRDLFVEADMKQWCESSRSTLLQKLQPVLNELKKILGRTTSQSKRTIIAANMQPSWKIVRRCAADLNSDQATKTYITDLEYVVTNVRSQPAAQLQMAAADGADFDVPGPWCWTLWQMWDEVMKDWNKGKLFALGCILIINISKNPMCSVFHRILIRANTHEGDMFCLQTRGRRWRC